MTTPPPERTECGHEDASLAIGRLLAPGDSLTLNLPDGQNDRDEHDRLIRYVNTSEGVDLGLMQLQAGHAIARYDSTDGYPEHPRQSTYHSAQLATLSPDGFVITVACQPAVPSPEPFMEEAVVEEAVVEEDPWWEQYSSCTKLKKNTAGHPTGPFRQDHPDEAAIYNWFAYGTGNRGDGDNDGLACE